MAGPYQKLLRKKLDLSPLGLARSAEETQYFCTPKNAKIIGWANENNIHFCFIHGFGETVFAVSPLNRPGEYIHPVARDFTDFLRLILTCGSTLPLEQVWHLSEQQFTELLWSYLPTPDQQRALDSLQHIFDLSPMEQPYIYLRGLQSSFDYSRILFNCEGENAGFSSSSNSKWKVCFPGHEGNRSRAGEELLVAKEFTIEGNYYYIPSIYLCSSGLVLDLCFQLSSNFYSSPEEIDRRLLDLTPVVNGKQLCLFTRSSEVWNPEMPGSEMPAALAHYSLDSTTGWCICRYSFAWVTRRRPITKSIHLLISPAHVNTPDSLTESGQSSYKKASQRTSLILF